MNDYMVNNVVRDIRVHAGWAGLKLDGELTVHAFRKSCGQNLANHLPMNVVKELMGHADIGTTAEFYGTVSREHEMQTRLVSEAVTSGTARTQSDVGLTFWPKSDPSRKVG